MFKKWSGMNMESDRKQDQFNTHKKNHWKIIVAKDYGIRSKILKVKHGDQIETTYIVNKSQAIGIPTHVMWQSSNI
jgi:hypothetical protein